MDEWVKTKDRLPEKNVWVEVKATVFSATTGHAILIDTEWGTTGFLYGGIIYMTTDMVTEWRPEQEDGK